ncbi:Uncharacterized protein GBIM_13701, partial [Gryllus bimaculatus]
METHSRRIGGSPGSNKVTVPFYVPPPSVKKTSAEIINEARASIRKGGTMGISVSPSEVGMGFSPSVRPLDTKRPFTPRERQRTLFGSSNNYSRRPPSSFSLGYLQFQEPDLGSTTPPNLRRLNPLPFSPSSSLNSSLNSSLSSSGSSADQSTWRALVSGDALDLSDSLPSNFKRRERAGSSNVQASKFLPCFDGSPPKVRLPAIGSGSHLITRRSQFRATASLDNLPEEVEGEDLESPGSSNSENSTREPPPIRKAYSSPVQRTRSRDVDMEKDIFGPLETNDLHSPTSNKRSHAFENEIIENSRKKDKKFSNDEIAKKCKDNAWGLKQNDSVDEVHKLFANSQEPYKSSKRKETLEIHDIISSNTEEHAEVSSFKSIIENSPLDDLRSEKNAVPTKTKDNIKKENKEDKMDEDLLEIQPEIFKLTKPSKENNNFKNELKTEEIRTSINHENGFVTPKAVTEKQISDNNKKQTSEIIESSRMFENLGMNDTSSLPVSPDTQYLASAKEALLSDFEETKGMKISGVRQTDAKNIEEFIPQKPFKKSENLKISKSAIEIKKSPSEQTTVSEDPILGAIQQAMLDRFPPKETSDRPSEISSRPKSGRAKSAKKSAEQSISDNVRNALEMLSNLSQQDGNDIEVILALSKLYRILDSESAFGLNIKNTKLKSQVLKVIYKFVERSNETLLLQIARIILGFRVNGSNLSGVCKLVFKVSRCDKNDRLFLEDNILELFVEALGSASPLEDAEACVYGYGALKFLTMNNLVLSAVLSFGILELMVLHMKLVNVARSEGSRIPEQTSHALFQLTGALRNVAGEEDIFPQFVSTGAVSELCRAMELFSSDLDVISNVSRTLSIISTHDDCCNAIISYDNCFQLFVKLLQKYPGRQDIVVRLGYALGNLMAKSEMARMKLYEEEGAVSSMLNLLSIYLEKDQQMQDLETHNHLISSDAGSNGSIEDVIVKIFILIEPGKIFFFNLVLSILKKNVAASRGNQGIIRNTSFLKLVGVLYSILFL